MQLYTAGSKMDEEGGRPSSCALATSLPCPSAPCATLERLTSADIFARPHPGHQPPPQLVNAHFGEKNALTGSVRARVCLLGLPYVMRHRISALLSSSFSLSVFFLFWFSFSLDTARRNQVPRKHFVRTRRCIRHGKRGTRSARADFLLLLGT